MNVLFVTCDDLRPALGVYGSKQSYTPNFDNFATESLRFERAYTQQAICNPSRSSFLTGRRPSTTQVYNLLDSFRTTRGANWVTLPQWFKERGYHTTPTGKLFHSNNIPASGDYPLSWTDTYQDGGMIETRCPGNQQGLYGCTSNEPNETFTDFLVLQQAITALQARAVDQAPFWIGVGFHRPHIPWRIPDWIDSKIPAADDILLPTHRNVPTNMPSVAWQGPQRFPDSSYSFDTPLNEADTRLARHWYYGAVAYSDHLFGELLKEVEKLGFKDSTMIVLVSDHGYHLGEHNLWEKMTDFELGTRIPLMIHVPDKPTSHGQVTTSLIELVDLYRTIADLAGFPVPSQNPIEGESLSRLFNNPTLPGKPYAYSQFPRCVNNQGEPHGSCANNAITDIKWMGYSIRSEGWRYTEWVGFNGVTNQPDWDSLEGRELYDHTEDHGGDFDSFENVNVVDEPEHAELVLELSVALREAFGVFGNTTISTRG